MQAENIVKLMIIVDIINIRDLNQILIYRITNKEIHQSGNGEAKQKNRKPPNEHFDCQF